MTTSKSRERILWCIESRKLELIVIKIAFIDARNRFEVPALMCNLLEENNKECFEYYFDK